MNTLTENSAEHAQAAISYNSKVTGDKPVFMTGEGIICFKPWLAEARTNDKGIKNYEIAVAFPEKCQALKDLGSRVVAFKKEVWGDARKLSMPFKKGSDYCETYLADTELTPEEIETFEERYGWMRGYVFFNAKTKFDLNEDETKPQLIDRLRRLQDPSKVNGGAVVRLMVAPFKFETSGNKGVALGLRGCQVLKESESFSGQRNSASAFGAVGEPDEDDAAGAFAEPDPAEELTPQPEEAEEILAAEAEAAAKKKAAADKRKAAAAAKKKAAEEAEAGADAPLEDDSMFG